MSSIPIDPLRGRAQLVLGFAENPRVDAFIEMLRAVEGAYVGLAALEYAVDYQYRPGTVDPARTLRDLEAVVRVENPLVIARLRMESPGILDIAGKAIDVVRIAARVLRRLGRYGEAEIEEKRANADLLTSQALLQRELARLVRVSAADSEVDLYERLNLMNHPAYSDRIIRTVERRLELVDGVVDTGLITGAEVREETRRS